MGNSDDEMHYRFLFTIPLLERKAFRSWDFVVSLMYACMDYLVPILLRKALFSSIVGVPDDAGCGACHVDLI